MNHFYARLDLHLYARPFEISIITIILGSVWKVFTDDDKLRLK
jgi:hypothetical protein